MELLVDSDAHEPEDQLPPELADRIAAGVGLNVEEPHALLVINPQSLPARLCLGPIPAPRAQGLNP